MVYLKIHGDNHNSHSTCLYRLALIMPRILFFPALVIILLVSGSRAFVIISDNSALESFYLDSFIIS